MPDRFSSTVAASQNIAQSFFDICTNDPSSTAYFFPISDPSGQIQWESRSRSESLQRVQKIHLYLKSICVSQGSKVAILSGTRPEWIEIDIAILSLGGICVSIYPSLPATDVGFILADSESTIIFAENQEQVDKLCWLSQNQITLPARDHIPESVTQITFKKVIVIEELLHEPIETIALSKILAYELPQNFSVDTSSISRDSISSLVYTSGTTGPAKGVIQTHGNHLANVEQAILSKMFALSGTLFLFLPLAHSFARLLGYVGFLTPVTLKFCGVSSTTTSKVDLVRVAKEMCSASSNVVPAVPRLFEKIKDSLFQKSTGTKLSSRILKMTINAARKTWDARTRNTSVSLLNQIVFTATASIRLKIKQQIFGKDFQHGISGGAKLPVDVAEFFWSLEIPIFEGYGLTETCVATNVNRTDRFKIGSVGPAVERVETKIAEDGEILFKGPNITKGYFNRPAATNESWDSEGWFHTGDIGRLDNEGFLFITDRKKDIIVTAGGKKVPPLKVENLLTRSPFIDHAIYIGDGRPFCIALVSLNQSAIATAPHPENRILELIQQEVNKELATFEEVKKIGVIPDELTVENGMLTPTLKVKRKVIINKYSTLIDSLYIR
jgi:long-chain acyl-CoA synthetase